jgi:uncharacterized protein (DUF2147 family)
MPRRYILAAIALMTCLCVRPGPAQADATALDPSGYWKLLDERRGLMQTVVAVYLHDGVLYGRNIINYDEDDGTLIDTIYTPQRRAEVDGRPYLTQIDFIWGLRLDGNRWTGGHILDPRNGHVYACEAWYDDEVLIVRGRIGPLGRRLRFHPVASSDLPAGFVLPSTAGWNPTIPER